MQQPERPTPQMPGGWTAQPRTPQTSVVPPQAGRSPVGGPYWPEPQPVYAQGPYQSWRQMGLNELLLDNGIIFLDLPLDPRIMINGNTVCSHVIKSMLHLSVKRDQEINLYINCPGGDIDDTLAIYDTMQFLRNDIATYCIGNASSGAAIILAAGTKGKRYALPHAKVMIHQPWGYVGGQAADMRIQAEEIQRIKKTLIEILAYHTGKSTDQIERDTERDRYMTAAEALEYGLIDEILEESKGKKRK